jgi:hypothetical protein
MSSSKRSNRRDAINAFSGDGGKSTYGFDGFNDRTSELFADVGGVITALDDGSVRVGAFLLSSVGLSVEGTVSKDDWLSLMLAVRRVQSSVQWIVGDWLNYGVERKWGETYEQFAEMTGYSVQALKDMAWVSKAYEMSFRKDELSFKHHKVVADLDTNRRAEILQTAINERLSASDLQALRDGHNVVNPTTIDRFERRFGGFLKFGLRLKQSASQDERQQIAARLRLLADQIESDE